MDTLTLDNVLIFYDHTFGDSLIKAVQINNVSRPEAFNGTVHRINTPHIFRWTL